MRVGYTQEIRCLERVEWSQRVFSYLTLDISINIDTVFRIKSNSLSLSLSFTATQQQQVSALHIPINLFCLFFLSAKDGYHLVWESRLCGYGSDTIFWIYSCWYDYCINAYDCQGSQNGMEPLNVYVWKMRMQLLLKEQDPFFHSWEKRGRSGANGFFNQVSDDVVVAKQQKKAYEQHR